MPRPAHLTRPNSMSWGTSRWTVATGTAKPTPALEPLVLKMAVVTPMSRPWESSSGPPELPGLIEASVWITSSMTVPATLWISRPSALITPVLSELSSPKGLPMASTFWPTTSSFESPSGSGFTAFPLGSIASTARSLRGS